MGKLTSKEKHTVKVGNHTHTNMISKTAIVRRAQMQDIGNEGTSNLLKTNLCVCVCVCVCIDCCIKTSWEQQTKKSTIDTHTKKKKESKHSTKASHQITREVNKKGKE